MKRLKRALCVILVLITVLSLTGCGKTLLYKGGEKINYPFEVYQERKGSLRVTLSSGAQDADYRWKAESSDEALMAVEVVKAEKNGAATYRIIPKAEGTVQVSFLRTRGDNETPGAVTGTEAPAETTETSDAPATEPVADSDIVIVPIGDGSDSGIAIEAPLTEEDTGFVEYDPFKDRYIARDVTGEIVLTLNSVATGKKGKLVAAIVSASEKVNKGAIRSENTEVDYTLWKDDMGILLVRLPASGGEWTDSCETAPDPEALLMYDYDPESDENEFDVDVIDYYYAGFIEGAICYNIRPTLPGTAVLTFESAELKKKLTVNIEVTDMLDITVKSHSVESTE